MFRSLNRTTRGSLVFNPLQQLLLAASVAATSWAVQAEEWQLVETATIEQGKATYVRGVGYYTDNQATVEQADSLSDQLRLVVTSSTLDVTNATGTTEEGMPYFELTDISESVRIYFASARARLSYTAALYQIPSIEKPNPTVVEPVVYTEGSVHDPSVIKVDETYYVFGSHLAAAKSTDLMSWEVFSSDVESSPLFEPSYAAQVADGVAWEGGTVGSWAADAIQLNDGRYYLYYDHCGSPDTGECDNSHSYLGVSVSDDIEGPYEDLGLILRSGYADQYGLNEEDFGGYIKPDYNGYNDPNAIDPTLFWDKEGKLWMVYGSYSGGIYILEMDPDTGFAKEEGYGTHVMGGGFSAIEGPFMIYSPETDYYYLFTSWGGFAQNDGYNMRLSRSRNPNGPFYDAAGNDMVLARSNWDNMAPYGVKMMGGFMFDSRPGDPGSDYGYMAPGHNSAFYDEETGQYMLIFHTRFPDKGEGHQIRVHEMFMNSDEWLVPSPMRYAPIEGENIVDPVDLLGTYQFINHEKDINRTVKVSSYLTLEESGVIGGDYSGSYALGESNQITLTIDELGTFYGVLAWQWNDNLQLLVPTFSALSTEGVTIWGSQLPAQTTEEALVAIQQELTFPATIISNVTLETEGAQGATISWHSSNPDVIATDGVVNRPNSLSEDALVTLTATISLHGQVETHSVDILVKARYPFNRVAHYGFEGDLNDSLALQATGSVTGSTLLQEGGTESYVEGVTGQAIYLDGATGIRLGDDLIEGYDYTVSFWLNPEQLTSFSTAFFGAAANDRWLSLVPQCWDGNTMLWSGSQGWFDGTTSELIAANSWTHVAFTVSQGTLRVYLDGVQKFSGTGFWDLFSGSGGIFALGVNYWDLPLQGLVDEVKIYDVALTASEIRTLEIEQLSTEQLLTELVEDLTLTGLSSVKADLELPMSADYAAVISWSSSNPDVLDADGRVTRPEEGEDDVVLTLTATITLDGQSLTKEFSVTVKSLGMASPVAQFDFDSSSLEDATGTFGSGSVTGAYIGTTDGSVSYAEGLSGQALVLDGLSGVQLPDQLITNNSYTVSLWLKPEVITSFTTAFFGYANDASWLSLVPMSWDGNTMVWSNSGAWFDGSYGEVIPTGSWSHLAFSVDQGTITAYLNGEVKYQGAGFADIFSAGSSHFTLGVNFWDTPYQGLIDEVKVYDTVLSAEEIQAQAMPQPVAKFSFDETDLSDASGNFEAGSVTGTIIGTTDGSVSYAEGVSGQALYLNGSSGVQLPEGLISSNSYSISYWLKPEVLTTNTASLFGYTSIDSWMSMVLQNWWDGQPTLWSFSSDWYSGVFSQGVVTDEWQHLVITVSEGTLTTYLNGELTFQGTGFPDMFSALPAQFTLGVNFWDIPYQGYLDEVEFYEEVLSSSAVQEIYDDLME